ncbi:hypothetical protein [Streptomyces roseolus]|uniref:hypothetical protein n=1 Tax=Streptomyces roseolus TaxID=67358 RepID=UPI003796231D
MFASMWAERSKADAKGTALEKYATTEALGKMRLDLARMREAGTVVRGAPRQTGTAVTALDLTADIPTATLSSCVDMTTYERYDTRAKKMIPLPAEQPMRYAATATLEKWDAGWIVTAYTPHGQQTCCATGGSSRGRAPGRRSHSGRARRRPRRRPVRGRRHRRLGLRRGLLLDLRHRPGRGRRRERGRGERQFVGADAPAPDEPVIDPAVLARRAVDSMRLDGPVVASPRAAGTYVIGMPMWMRAEISPSTFGPVGAAASAGVVTVTAAARVTSVRWDVGDGTTVTCADSGIPAPPTRARTRPRIAGTATSASPTPAPTIATRVPPPRPGRSSGKRGPSATPVPSPRPAVPRSPSAWSRSRSSMSPELLW